ncbi:MAG: endonuclease [Mucilaginibacter sp.]|nr:endonuclease [Mucilaginibacter sp.]
MKFKKALLIIERFVLYFNFFFAALLLLSYLSPLISPQKFWPLAILGLFYLILLSINLLFCVYWVIRLKKYFFISAIIIILGFNVLLDNVGFNYCHKTLSSSSKADLKLMTYNVHNFENTLNLPAHGSILQLINLSQPDVIGFEEFNFKPSIFKVCDSLRKILNTDQFYFEPFIKTQYDSTGLALFSKYPIINHGIIRLSNERNENQVIYIDIKYQSTIVRIYAFHLQSLELKEQDYNSLNSFSHRGIISLPELKRIILKLKEGFIQRGQQVELICQHASKCPYPYIFMGDFNDTPSSYAFNQMAIRMNNAFRDKGTGIGKTFNGGFASFQIDYILVSKQFHVLDYQIIHKVISDHYPVLSDVALN